MAIRRGVSFYSYQQAQFFKWLDLEGQLRELGENLEGADGIELLDEMSLRYPDPPDAFVRQWHEWIDRWQLVPVTMDVFWDVLQFRDHVMSHHEGAERLIHDIRLAKRLGFANVRTLATTEVDVMIEALPVAEELGIRLGREIHQPMGLTGPHVDEIVQHGSDHLGIVLDCGVFQFRPSEPLLQWYIRQGARPGAGELAIEISLQARVGEGPLAGIDISRYTAQTVRSEFLRHLKGETVVQPDLRDAYATLVELVRRSVPDPSELEFAVIAEALNFSHVTREQVIELAPSLIGVHGKFYGMTERPDMPGTYEDISVDYETAIEALSAGGFDGYVNSEYEGQRFYQDRDVEHLEDEVEQVRRHQEMLRRLIGA
jgi:hypothetical protein